MLHTTKFTYHIMTPSGNLHGSYFTLFMAQMDLTVINENHFALNECALTGFYIITKRTN